MITDYGTLQSSIKAYLYNRKDLDDRIPGFIQIAEMKIFRALRAPENEKAVQFTIPEGQTIPRITEPTDFLEIKFLKMNGTPLTRISDIDMETKLSEDPAPGLPSQFARVLNEYVFWRIPDSNYTVDLFYWTDFSDTPLSDDTDTNPILTTYPDLYLYGALLEAMPFLVDDQRVGTWQTLFGQTMEYIEHRTTEQEYSGSPVSVGSPYSDRGMH